MADVNQYMEWSKHRATLDEIINSESKLLQIITSSPPSSQEFQETQQKIISVQNYIHSTQQERKTFTQQEKINESKPSLQNLIDQLKTKHSFYAVSEKVIDYLFTLDQKENIPKIINESVRYANISYFDKSLNLGKQNKFYIDLSRFEPLINQNIINAYLERYSNISTETELKQFEKDLQDNIFTAETQLLTELLQKHKKNIPKSQQEFLASSLIEYTLFKDIKEDIKRIKNKPADYFQEKKKIQEKVEQIQQLTQPLSLPIKLEQRYISTIIELETKINSIDNNQINRQDILYLKKNAEKYEEIVINVKREISKRKEEISDKIIETKNTISNLIDTELSILNPRVEVINTHYKVLQKLLSYAKAIQNNRTTLSVEILESKIRPIIFEYENTSLSRDTHTTPSLKDLPATYSPLPPTYIPPTDKVPHSLNITPEKTTTTYESFPEFNNALDILVFSNHYGINKDTPLAKMCLALSGYTKQDKMTKTLLKDRVDLFLAQEKDIISRSSEEKQIYNHLKQAVELYLK